MKGQSMRWILLGVVVLLFLGMQQTVPKEALAGEGDTCTEDEECVCWGEVTEGTNNYGVGVARCVNGACDMTYCFDVQDVGDWARDKPLNWVKENMLMTVAIIGLLGVVIFWPKM